MCVRVCVCFCISIDGRFHSQVRTPIPFPLSASSTAAAPPALSGDSLISWYVNLMGRHKMIFGRIHAYASQNTAMT